MAPTLLVLSILVTFCCHFVVGQVATDLIITGVCHGDYNDGPRFIEFYALNDIDDLGEYGVGIANNGGGSDGIEIAFPDEESASKGDFIYAAQRSRRFEHFMGFVPDYTANRVNFNGDDPIELFRNGHVVDVYGDVQLDGTGKVWEYKNGWGYRKSGTGADGDDFDKDHWTYSQPDALDGETKNEDASKPFPTGSYRKSSGGGGGGGNSKLVITGVIDGPRTGGLPKAIELYVLEDIDDLSEYGVGSANNGNGGGVEEFTFDDDSADKGEYIYVSRDRPEFEEFFGFFPNYVSNSAMAINGDDAIELFFDGEVVDTFGQVDVDGTGKGWEYVDGWAYRKKETGPDEEDFDIDNWTFSGKNSLDGATTNDGASKPFPIKTYGSAETSLIITGVIDGPLIGGLPKAVELYVLEDIDDFTAYGIGSANNGGGSDGEEGGFLGDTSPRKGTYIYIASEQEGFQNFFGFPPDATSSIVNVNGDDAIELFKDGQVVDTFGEINRDGSGRPWEYMDGWAYRKSDTGPDGKKFVLNSWTFSGRNALDGEAKNSNADEPFPWGTYATPESDLVITGVIDGPLEGGLPKAVELYAINDIRNIGDYGIGSANNGGGTDGEEGALPNGYSANKGQYIYIASESDKFYEFFGFNPEFTSGAVNVNGDDAIELFKDGLVVDTFGEISEDGSGKPWEYMDGWAYRKEDTGPDGVRFIQSNWMFSGRNALDGESSNEDAEKPFPLRNYGSVDSNLVITGVIDGPLFGGLPKALELYVLEDIDDLSDYGLGSANNGLGSDGQEYTFEDTSVNKGNYIYVASEEDKFEEFFGFLPDYTSTAALAINGDDAVELFKDGVVADVFGQIHIDGTNKAWEYLDGWAYRKKDTGPDGSYFVLSNWQFSGKNALDGESANEDAEEPFPLKTYAKPKKEKSDLIITGVIDGPLVGGLPKAVELYATASFSDLNKYGLGSANNGAGSDGSEFDFSSGSINKGDFIYIASESTGFKSFFGFEPHYTSGALGINGNDAMELFKNEQVVDVFGEIDNANTGLPWDHMDGWAYRKDGTDADGDEFDINHWKFSGRNALDGEQDNKSANKPFPLASYSKIKTDLLITGVIDGPITGGVPKAVELYASAYISDLSEYGLGSANNGGGTNGQEFTFPNKSLDQGHFIYIASESIQFDHFFGFEPDYTSSAALINGDDAIELFRDGKVVDIFGDINKDGTGLAWEYMDGWAYRKDGRGPDGNKFMVGNWKFSGENALDGEDKNEGASKPFPVRSFSPVDI